MFDRLLARGIKQGCITLIDWRGRAQTFGRGEPRITVRLTDRATDWGLALNPWLKVGEAYMDGKFVIEEGTLYDLIDLGVTNTNAIQDAGWQKVMAGFHTLARWWHQNNPIGLARQHVAHHYDLSRRLFELFLDESMQYSCGYFLKPTMTLAEAQAAKMRHIASKLLLEPGQRVFDIGCGWGGLAIYLARQCGVEVVGVTLSKEQHELATQRAKDAGVDKQVTFKLQDYRLETGHYDRIVSVGMFEHVGVKHYGEFFATVERLLKPTGVALLHAIGRRDGPGFTNPWLRKYIFPGGYTPALSEVVPFVEKTSLWISDIEVLRLHYADTLRCWRENFNRHRAEIARIYDERFCRMWEFYLIGSELSFRRSFCMVWQMQLARDVNAVPLSRDYMLDWERRAALPARRSSRERAAE
ncbi:MAG TPA: cyclopropane-fatty-acyl-phospholipid synthase family protein [Dongiaceae bacterium]